jgi:hypothetical protein
MRKMGWLFVVMIFIVPVVMCVSACILAGICDDYKVLLEDL